MLILGALGLAGLLFFLMRRDTTGARVAVPAVGMPAGAVGVSPTTFEASGIAAGVATSGVVPGAGPLTCQERAIMLAQQQLGLPMEGLTVRSLLPQDLGLTTWSLNLASANAWNTGVISTNVGDNRFLCITGVSYSGSAAEQVRVQVGASTVASFSIEQVPGITTTHHVDIAPILAQQNLPVSVDIYASAISATEDRKSVV